MRYYDDNTMEAHSSSASFYKDDDSKRPSFADDDDELQLEEIFNASRSSLASRNSSNASASTVDEGLIRQFNASVGSKALEPTVASFYLEMCDNDLRTAVAFFQEENGASGEHGEQVQAYVPSKPAARPRKSKSLDSAPVPPPRYGRAAQASRRRSSRARRIKSMDAAEEPCVTAPSAHRSDHSRYPAPKASPQPRESSSARFSHRRATQFVPPQNSRRRATQMVAQMPDRRRATAYGRSKSERFVREKTQQGLKSASSHSFYGSMKDSHYNEAAPVTVTRPPTARGDAYRSRSWEPPSRRSSQHNPAA